jgi:dihydrofolate reductase
MRKVLYGGAMSLDGYIAGPNGEYDWIVMDPEIDFAALMGRYDTFLIGRRTFEAMQGMVGGPPTPGIRHIVCSRTLRPGDCPPGMTLTADPETTVRALRAERGKDIAVFGGGDLFRSLLAVGLVDEVHVSLVPVLLGGGIPFLPAPAGRARLALKAQRTYKTTGTVGLEYAVVR